MAYVHPTNFRFYIRRYPEKDGETTPVIDIEEEYDCRYMKFDGLLFNGDVKNTYSEEFPESSGVNLWLPGQQNLAYKSKECTLKLRFMGGDVESRSRKFYTDFRGVKVEYHDTFRNRYVSLLLTKTPVIEYQKLRDDTSYMVVSYSFDNFLGFPYNESRIK